LLLVNSDVYGAAGTASAAGVGGVSGAAELLLCCYGAASLLVPLVNAGMICLWW
jgi:hypothetical protein